MSILNKIKSLFDSSVQEVQPQIIEPQIDEKMREVIKRQADTIYETYRNDADARRNAEYERRLAEMKKEVEDANSAPCDACGETKLITKYGPYDQKLSGSSSIRGSVNSTAGLFGVQGIHGDMNGNGSLDGHTEQVPRLVCTSCGNERLKAQAYSVARYPSTFQAEYDYMEHFTGEAADDWAKQFYVESHLAFANDVNFMSHGMVHMFDIDYRGSRTFPKFILKKDLNYYRNMGLKFYSDEN